jgi:hypothetical protein
METIMITPNNKPDMQEKLGSTYDTLTKNGVHKTTDPKSPDHKTADHKTADPKNPDYKTVDHKTADPKNPDNKSMSSQQGFKGLSDNDGKCDTNKDMKK